MKKFLSIFTMTVLTMTASTNIIACNNSNVPAVINTVKFKLMDGIKEAFSFAIDSKDNLYANDRNGNIYKCLAGKSEFKKFAKINVGNDRGPNEIKIDNNDNIFILADSKVYKCLAEKDTFQEIFNRNEGLWSIAIDKNNNIYIGSYSGSLYKYLANETVFREIKKVPEIIWSIVIDKNNNIFFSTNYEQGSEIYRCLAGENSFKKINSFKAFDNCLVLDNNNIYVGTKLAINTNDGFLYGFLYRCLAGETNFVEIARLKNDNIYDITFDKNDNMYAISSKNVYQMLANDKNIHVINNQFSKDHMGHSHRIIINQKNKVYISNFVYGVYESY